jgi:hypothetical protein
MLLSLVMPGLGQVYNGHLSKAIFFFFAFSGSIYLITEGHPLPFAVFLPFIIFSNMIDAYRSATLINARGTAAVLEEDDMRVAGLGHRPGRDGPAPLPQQHGLAPSLRPRPLLADPPHRRRARAPASVHAAQGWKWHVPLGPRCWCWACRSSRWAWPGSSAMPGASTSWPRCAPGGL